jgi:hypothetical protein
LIEVTTILEEMHMELDNIVAGADKKISHNYENRDNTNYVGRTL